MRKLLEMAAIKDQFFGVYLIVIELEKEELLRIILLKGRLIFVEEEGVNSNPNEENCFMREMIIFCLAHFFNCNIFEIFNDFV